MGKTLQRNNLVKIMGQLELTSERAVGTVHFF